ncbi:MAG: LON peptidase substrate-binding domain-containing protein [Armatimonadota bacterium]|nr:LON peptidase substrate-binding domain-containing protein [Armatimonadota bacterium]MCX7776773.1 LON peptidase substrate-binding domain-containing protein [Armatimonadota bacterium]MDW8024570.1 LON peptidase substrate-binding domain-containing protein [Armatimonadota bacterium]
MSQFETELPLLEINNVLFPHARMTIEVKGEHNEFMVISCLTRRIPFGAVLVSPDGLRKLAERKAAGTAAGIIHVERSPDGILSVLTRGYRRFRLIEIVREEPYIMARVQFPSGFITLHSGMLSLSNRVAATFQRYVELVYEPQTFGQREFALPTSPIDLAFAAAAMLHIPPLEKQMLLEIFNAHELLALLLKILQREIARLNLDEDYKLKVRSEATIALPKIPPIGFTS